MTPTTLPSVTFPDGHSITVGQDASVSCCDTHPARVYRNWEF